jgi:RNA polymerase sigma factor (sigma-70 family)
MIDAQLLQSCIKNDKKAQYLLYKRCFSFLMSVCIRYKKQEEDARAVLNIGFLKILNNLDKYQPHVPFEAWIRRIMINTVIDEFRKNRKRLETFESTNFEVIELYDTHHSWNEADLNFDAEELEGLVKKLPPTSQKVFNLFAIDGFSHKEISDMMDINVGASKWHVSNSRKLLKEMISKKLQLKKIA